VESVRELNQRLDTLYGKFDTTDYPLFRIVRAGEQLTKREDDWEDRTPEGLFIRRVREIREVPKYFNIDASSWVMEMRHGMDYDCLWNFRDKEPTWIAIEFLAKTVLAQMEGKQPKYVDERADPEKNQARLNKIREELFGDITKVEDAFATGRAVVVPNSYEKVH
jgi:hypothetical protein